MSFSTEDDEQYERDDDAPCLEDVGVGELGLSGTAQLSRSAHSGSLVLFVRGGGENKVGWLEWCLLVLRRPELKEAGGRPGAREKAERLRHGGRVGTAERAVMGDGWAGESGDVPGAKEEGVVCVREGVWARSPTMAFPFIRLYGSPPRTDRPLSPTSPYCPNHRSRRELVFVQRPAGASHTVYVREMDERSGTPLGREKVVRVQRGLPLPALGNLFVRLPQWPIP